MKKKLQHTKGFSLSELLITTAIIAVLVSCSIPIFASQLEKSKRAVDISNAQTIRSAITNLLNDGTLTFLKDDMGFALFVVPNGINFGLINGKWDTDILINGKPYDIISNNIMVHFPRYGISRNTKIKQSPSSATWYGAVVYGSGESYYYEGTGKVASINAETARKYSWDDLDTPLSP